MKDSVNAPISLPAGWKRFALATLAEVFIDGNWIETKDQATTGIRLVQTGNVGTGNFKDRREKARYIDDETFARLNCSEVHPRDILISRLPDPVGRACIVPDTGERMITAVDCSIVRPKAEMINSSFFVYYTQTTNYLRAVDDRCSGTTRRRISRKKLGQIPIPLPPMVEQKRIVAVLDQAFAALDRARANTKANLADAESVFRSGIDEILRERSDWITGRFEDVVGEVKTGPFGSLLHKSDYIENGIPIVNPANILDGVIQPSASKTVSAEALARLSNYQLSTGDLVIGRRGEMGRCAVVTNQNDGWLCGTGSFFIRTKPGVDPQLVAHILRTSEFVEKLTSIAGGATMLNLNNKALADMNMVIPSRDSSRKILRSIEALSSIKTALLVEYKKKILDLDNLRQSILEKAFSGQLI